MKKKLVTLCLAAVLIFSLTACGSKEASESEEPSNAESFIEELTTEESQKEENGSLIDTLGFSSLSEWYDSADRIQTQLYLNTQYKDAGIRFELAIEGEDILIYNTYLEEQQVFDQISPEELNEHFSSMFSSLLPNTHELFDTFETEYGFSLKAIRVAYFNADGTQLYSQDITRDSQPQDGEYASTMGVTYDSLEDWVNSDAKVLLTDEINSYLTDTGMTADFAADGDALLLRYYFEEELAVDGFSQEELNTLFESSVDTSALSPYFDAFKISYNLEISAVRVIIYNADGSKLYQTEITE